MGLGSSPVGWGARRSGAIPSSSLQPANAACLFLALEKHIHPRCLQLNEAPHKAATRIGWLGLGPPWRLEVSMIPLPYPRRQDLARPPVCPVPSATGNRVSHPVTPLSPHSCPNCPLCPVETPPPPSCRAPCPFSSPPAKPVALESTSPSSPPSCTSTPRSGG